MPRKTFRLTEHLATISRAHLLDLRSQLPGFPERKGYMKAADIATELEAALLDLYRLRQIWNSLDDGTRIPVLRALADPATPGMLDTRVYMIHHAQPLLRIIERPGNHRSDFVTVATPLAMFFDEDYCIPVDLADALRRMLHNSEHADAKFPFFAPAQPELPASEQYHRRNGEVRDLSLTQIETEAHAFHDLLATLRMIEAGKLKVNSKTLMPAQLALKALNNALSLREYANTEAESDLRVVKSIRTFGLISIALETGWATADETGRLMLTTDGMAFVQQPTPGALRAAFTRWLQNGIFDEVSRIEALHGAMNALMQQGTAPAQRRIPVAAALAAMPSDEWLDVETFFRMVLITGNDFEVEHSLRSLIWIGSEQIWNNQLIGATDSEMYWRIVKCQLMLVLLFEPLACFGVVDIAYLPPRSGMYHRGIRGSYMLDPVVSHYDVLRYVRVTPLGRYLLGNTEQYTGQAPSSGPMLRVLPNQQIVVTSRLAGTKAGHPILTKFCDRMSDDVYQLSPTRLLKTIEKQEMSIGDVIAYLERESNAALPQTVTSALEDIARRSSKISEIGDAVLFQVDDAHLALELEHDRTLQRAGCRRAGDWIVVPDAKAAVFRRRARELGYAVQEKERRGE